MNCVTSALRPRGGGTKLRIGRAEDVSARASALWGSCGGTWRVLHDDWAESGLSLEWHEFTLQSPMEWSRSFHPCCVELCFNLSGNGRIEGAGGCGTVLEASSASFYATGQGELRGWRQPGPEHRFVIVRCTTGLLRERLSRYEGALHPLIEARLRSDSPPAAFAEPHRLTTEQEQGALRMLRPPVPQVARPLWYQGEVRRLMAEFFFEPRGEDELFCDRQERVARERVDRVIAILRRRLAEPPTLEELGREAACSPFYLSRTFSREMRMTIPQYLRKLRMERAAELLRGGLHNVTEAALEVGYSSVSHFSQAFCQTVGCCPGLYSLKREQEQSAAKK
jgi:AraC family transcriptional regulator